MTRLRRMAVLLHPNPFHSNDTGAEMVWRLRRLQEAEAVGGYPGLQPPFPPLFPSPPSISSPARPAINLLVVCHPSCLHQQIEKSIE
jgi:hypothetical protein